jgi:hypothetical protein
MFWRLRELILETGITLHGWSTERLSLGLQRAFGNGVNEVMGGLPPFHLLLVVITIPSLLYIPRRRIIYIEQYYSSSILIVNIRCLPYVPYYST